MPVGKLAQQMLVGCGQRFQDAQYQRSTALADGDFDLRQTRGDRKGAEQFPQREQERRDVPGQDGAGTHVGDVAAAPLMEADQHAALAGHLAHAEPGPVAIAPRLALDRRQHLFRADATDLPETVFEHPLLDRHLRRRVEMLHRAAPAHAEMLAMWLHPGRRTGQHGHQVRQLVARLAPEAGVLDRLAGQGAGDEDRLAVQASDSPSFVI